MRTKVNVNSVRTKSIEIIQRSFDSAKWVKCRLGDGYGRSLSSPAKQREQPEKWRLVRFLAAQEPVTISTRSENIETPADSLSGQLTFPEQLSGWKKVTVPPVLFLWNQSWVRQGSPFLFASGLTSELPSSTFGHFLTIFLAYFLGPALCFLYLSEFCLQVLKP